MNVTSLKMQIRAGGDHDEMIVDMCRVATMLRVRVDIETNGIYFSVRPDSNPCTERKRLYEELQRYVQRMRDE